MGAHPGYADRENFGRVRMEMPPEAVESLVLYQIAALEGFVRSRGAALTHVKPHGALYNQAAKDKVLANAIARAVGVRVSELPMTPERVWGAMASKNADV